MTFPRLIVAFLACGALVHAQERDVPKDSERVSIPGCASGRSFISMERPNEPIRSPVAPGRRFRLEGSGKMLDEIKKQETHMVEVTGLVRRAQLRGSGGGVSIGGIRIGGSTPRAPVGGIGAGGVAVGSDTGYNETVLDLESWRPLPETCPSRK